MDYSTELKTSLSITNSQHFLKLMPIESVMPFNRVTLCLPLLLLPSIFPRFTVFSNQSVLRIRWPKYCSFSLSISPSNEYSGLISFRMDWLDLPAVQETLKSLLQHHSSKASVLQPSVFFILQLSHPYLTTGKNIDLTRWTFAGRVMPVLWMRCLGCSQLPSGSGEGGVLLTCSVTLLITALSVDASVSGLSVLSITLVCLSCTSTTFSISVVKKRSLYLSA